MTHVSYSQMAPSLTGWGEVEQSDTAPHDYQRVRGVALLHSVLAPLRLPEQRLGTSGLI
jgi:hypothetical protein